MNYMNEPRISKQTIKELREKLLSHQQSSQGHEDADTTRKNQHHNENDSVEHNDERKPELELEDEIEM